MKATEQYFSVVLFIMLYKLVQTFLSLWMKSESVAIQMKAIEQYLQDCGAVFILQKVV